MFGVGEIKRIGGIAGDIDGVGVVGVETDAAGIIFFGPIKVAARMGDEPFLPIFAGPAGIKIINATVEPIRAGDMIAPDAENAKGMAVGLISDLPTPRPARRDMVVGIGGCSFAVLINNGTSLA